MKDIPHPTAQEALNSRCLPPADHADTALLAPIRPFRSKRLAKTVPVFWGLFAYRSPVTTRKKSQEPS